MHRFEEDIRIWTSLAHCRVTVAAACMAMAGRPNEVAIRVVKSTNAASSVETTEMGLDAMSPWSMMLLLGISGMHSSLMGVCPSVVAMSSGSCDDDGGNVTLSFFTGIPS